MDIGGIIMDSIADCYDVVSFSIDAASKTFSPIFVVNNDRLDILKNYCENIDKLSERFGGVYYDTEVDEEDMTIRISLGCHEFEVYDVMDPFCSLVNRSMSFSVSKAEEHDCIELTFIFPSIWERTL